MQELRARVLTAVANPKTFLWAPFELAIVNIVLAIAFMLLCIAVLGITPFLSFVPLVLGHAVLVALGARDQHLTTVVQASGRYPRHRRHNLARTSKGAKFVP